VVRTEAGIRELRRHLSTYLRRTEAGKTVVSIRFGWSIGRIAPSGQSAEAQIEALSQTGLISWSGRKLQPLTPMARVR